MSNPVQITVRGYHIDAFGHVNNARYLEFLEEARWAIFDDKISSLKNHGWFFTIVNININYRQQAQLGQILKVDAKLARIGNKSFTLAQHVHDLNSDQILVDAEVTCVVVDSHTGKALPLAGEVLAILE